MTMLFNAFLVKEGDMQIFGEELTSNLAINGTCYNTELSG